MTLDSLPDGIHEGVPDAIYHQRLPVIANKSLLHALARSELDAREYIRGHRKQSDAFALGHAIEHRLESPHTFGERYITEPDFGDCRKTGKGLTKDTADERAENRARRDAWREANSHREVLTASDWQTVQTLGEHANADPHIRAILDAPGVYQATLLWRDEETGLRCKARPDKWIPSMGLMVDWKSARSASPRGFTQAIATYGYDLQAAHYMAGARACGWPAERFQFVCLEKRAPIYPVAMYRLSSQFAELGEARRMELLHRLRHCLHERTWNGYTSAEPDGCAVLEPPGWYVYEHDATDEDDWTMEVL